MCCIKGEDNIWYRCLIAKTEEQDSPSNDYMVTVKFVDYGTRERMSTSGNKYDIVLN